MDRIINWLLLIIIFVFDPLAIALVIAANFAFAQLQPKKEYPLEEQVEGMRKVVESYDDLQDEIKDWDSTLMDGLEDEEPMVYEPTPQDEDWKIVDDEETVTPVEEPRPEVYTYEPKMPQGLGAWARKKWERDNNSKRYF